MIGPDNAHSLVAVGILRPKGISFQWASFAFSSDGKLLAGGGGDNTVTFWSLETGRVHAKLKGIEGRKRLDMWEGPPNITHVAFSAHDKVLAAENSFDTVNVWDVETGKLLLARHPVHAPHYAWGSVSCEHSWKLSPDGKFLAVLDLKEGRRQVVLWDVATGQQRRSLTHSALPNHMAFAPDSKLLATATGVIRIWDVETGQEMRTLRAPTAEPSWCMHFSPDGARLASMTIKQTVEVWDVASGALLYSRAPNGKLRDIAFSPNGKLLAVTTYGAAHSAGDTELWGEAPGGIELWEAATGQELRTLGAGSPALPGVYTRGWGPPYTDYLPITVVTGVAFSHDGRVLAASNGNGSTKLWEVETGRELYTLPSWHDPHYADIRFSPDDTLLAVSEYSRGYVQLPLSNLYTPPLVASTGGDSDRLSNEVPSFKGIRLYAVR